MQTKWMMSPYTNRLQALLTSSPAVTKRYQGGIRITNAGIGGAGVTDRLTPALYQRLAEAQARPFDWVSACSSDGGRCSQGAGFRDSRRRPQLGV